MLSLPIGSAWTLWAEFWTGNLELAAGGFRDLADFKMAPLCLPGSCGAPGKWVKLVQAKQATPPPPASIEQTGLRSQRRWAGHSQRNRALAVWPSSLSVCLSRLCLAGPAQLCLYLSKHFIREKKESRGSRKRLELTWSLIPLVSHVTVPPGSEISSAGMTRRVFSGRR